MDDFELSILMNKTDISLFSLIKNLDLINAEKCFLIYFFGVGWSSFQLKSTAWVVLVSEACYIYPQLDFVQDNRSLYMGSFSLYSRGDLLLILIH